MTSQLRQQDDLDGLESDLERFGFCMIERLLDDHELIRARGIVSEREPASAGPVSGHAPDAGDWPERGGDQWVLLIAGECGLDNLVTHPVTLALARHLLGQQVQLSGFTAHVVHPGNQVMDLHTDQWWLPRPAMPNRQPSRPGDITRNIDCFGDPGPARHPINPAVVINVMWALSDFTASNGCTRLVPGSHLSGLEPDPARDWPTVNAEVPAGGAVVWDARTWHASGCNSSTAPRIGISTTYCGPQFRQLQNHTLALKPGAQAALSEEMRMLLGFRLFSSYGATDDDQAEYARPGYERE